MPLTFPLATDQLSDLLQISGLVWGEARNDQLSGDGSGNTWSAELAPPLWQAECTIDYQTLTESKRIAARIRQLAGPARTFYLVDPMSQYPAADPDGSMLGSSVVRVSSIAADRQSLSLYGLPANYQLVTGDKAHIRYSDSQTRNFFFEIAEDVTANGSGVTAEFAINFPAVPLAINPSAVVVLAQPSCRMFIAPGSFKPGTATMNYVESMSFRAVERR